MTTEELRAAAERVREYRRLRHEGIDWAIATIAVYGPLGEREHSPTADDNAVIDAYLALVSADDGEPVTWGWLVELGAREPHGFARGSAPTLTIPGGTFGVLVANETGVWDWRTKSKVIATLNTRGDVRRLAELLKPTEPRS